MNHNINRPYYAYIDMVNCEMACAKHIKPVRIGKFFLKIGASAII